VTAMHPSVQSIARWAALSHPKPLGEAVKHNVAAGRGPILRCLLLVLLVGIGNMDGFIETIPGVPPVEHVVTLGSLMISLLFFRSDRPASKSNFVGANHRSLRKQSQSVLTLHDDDLVSLHWMSK
jgi:hypothetical protein